MAKRYFRVQRRNGILRVQTAWRNHLARIAVQRQRHALSAGRIKNAARRVQLAFLVTLRNRKRRQRRQAAHDADLKRRMQAQEAKNREDETAWLVEELTALESQLNNRRAWEGHDKAEFADLELGEKLPDLRPTLTHSPDKAETDGKRRKSQGSPREEGSAIRRVGLFTPSLISDRSTAYLDTLTNARRSSVPAITSTLSRPTAVPPSTMGLATSRVDREEAAWASRSFLSSSGLDPSSLESTGRGGSIAKRDIGSAGVRDWSGESRARDLLSAAASASGHVGVNADSIVSSMALRRPTATYAAGVTTEKSAEKESMHGTPGRTTARRSEADTAATVTNPKTTDTVEGGGAEGGEGGESTDADKQIRIAKLRTVSVFPLVV